MGIYFWIYKNIRWVSACLKLGLEPDFTVILHTMRTDVFNRKSDVLDRDAYFDKERCDKPSPLWDIRSWGREWFSKKGPFDGCVWWHLAVLYLQYPRSFSCPCSTNSLIRARTLVSLNIETNFTRYQNFKFKMGAKIIKSFNGKKSINRVFPLPGWIARG